MTTALSLLAAAWILAASPAAPASPVLAEIGSQKLTLERFDTYWELLPAPRREAYAAQGGRRAFLDDIVKQKLMVVEAERLGLPSQPELAARLELQRETSLAQALVEREIASKIVAEEDLRAYYKEHAGDFKEPETLSARHILVTPRTDSRINNSRSDDAQTPEQARAKIERLQKELAQGADFGELARAWSEDVTASQSGALGEFTSGRMVKPFEDAALALEPGQVSDVVETVYGYHLIQLLERRPERVPAYEDVRDRIQALLRREKSGEFNPRVQQYVQELQGRTPVTIHAELLEGPPGKTSHDAKP